MDQEPDALSPATSPPASPESGAPIDGYDRLGAREVMRRILDLPRDVLLRLQAYEQRNQRRTQVLGAIRRAIDRINGRTNEH